MYLYSLTHAFLVLCVVQLLLLRENYIHGSSGSVIFYISYDFVIYFFYPSPCIKNAFLPNPEFIHIDHAGIVLWLVVYTNKDH